MSLQPPQAVFSFPPKILPVGIHLKNYADAFKTVPFGRLFLNSTIVAIMITAGKLITLKQFLLAGCFLTVLL